MNTKTNLKKLIISNYYLNKYAKNILQKIRPNNYDKYFGYYPIEMNLEITSLCNSHCSFCTRDEMFAKGYKELKNIDKQLAFKIIDKYKELNEFSKIPENLTKFIFVGLGEPLTHPDFFDIMSYAKKKFNQGKICLNTNGIILNEKNRTNLIKSDLDFLTISLCYFDKNDHQKYLQVDKYDQIISNIKAFLKQKGNNLPNVEIHIFDTEENKKVYNDFFKCFRTVLNSNDKLNLYRLNDLTKKRDKNIKQLSPCFSIWSIIASDFNGVFYPCCLGPMNETDLELSIGTVNDSIEFIFNKIKHFQQLHLNKNFGNCINCDILLKNTKQNNRIFKSYMNYQKRIIHNG